MERKILRRLSMALAGTLALTLVQPALAADPHAPNPDPYEGWNRKVFAFNQALDRAILRPLALTYKRVLPGRLREGVHNILANLTEPVVASNDILQLHFHQATLSATRLVINTTVGIGGIFDVASKLDDPHHDNGFDVTLGRYGVSTGPYLYLPVLGPSTIRGVAGYAVDGYLLDPLQWNSYPHKTAISLSRGIVGGLDARARFDDQLQSLMSDATDPYATLRSVYLQNEESQINANKPVADQPLPDFGDPTPAPGGPAAPAPAPSAQPTTEPAPPLPPAPAAPMGSDAAPAPAS